MDTPDAPETDPAPSPTPAPAPPAPPPPPPAATTVEPQPEPAGVPTAPRATGADGRLLDGWGLPLAGPARRVALAELGRPDPATNPEDWQ